MNETYDDTLETYLGQIDREIEGYINKGGWELTQKSVQQEVSYKMAFMDPTDHGLSYKTSAKCKCHSWSTKGGYGPPGPPG